MGLYIQELVFFFHWALNSQPLVQGTAEFLVRGITVLRQKQGASDKPYLLGASSQAFLQAGVRFSQVPHYFSAAHLVFAFGIPAQSFFFCILASSWHRVAWRWLGGNLFGKMFLSLLQLVQEVCMHFNELQSTTLSSLLFHQGLFSCGLKPSDFFVVTTRGCTSVLFQKFILKCSMPLKVTF